MKVFVVLVEEPASALGGLFTFIFFAWLLVFIFSPNESNGSRTSAQQIQSSRCNGNPDKAKCEAFEAQRANETPKQAQQRRDSLEVERQRNMAIVNDCSNGDVNCQTQETPLSDDHVPAANGGQVSVQATEDNPKPQADIVNQESADITVATPDLQQYGKPVDEQLSKSLKYSN